MISQFLTWNSDQSVAWGILRERSLSVGLLSIIGGKDEVVVLLNMLQGHLFDKDQQRQKGDKSFGLLNMAVPFFYFVFPNSSD